MKVVILCGGIGTRLREETEFRPKPMVTIGKHPILWHIMKIYSYFGYKDFILALGYKGEMIKDYFYHYDLLNSDVTIELGTKRIIKVHQCHDDNDWRITLVDTGETALKGSRLKKIQNYITDDVFMMTYGDGVSNVNIDKLLNFHRSHGKIVTVTGVNPASRFGELVIEGEQVLQFQEKKKIASNYVSGGYFVFNKDIFDYLKVNDDCDLEFGPLEQIAAQGQLMVYKHDGDWACMDTMRDMEYLNRLWYENKAFWRIWK